MSHAQPAPARGFSGRATWESAEAVCAVPGVCACVFDASWRVHWCCKSVADALGASTESLRGAELEAIVGADAAAERKALWRPALERGDLVRYVAMCNGKRCVVRAQPVDELAVGVRGVLVVEAPACSPQDGRGLPVAAVPVMGQRLGSLSKAEAGVAYLFARGLTVDQIATRLCRSTYTINDHVKSIHRKLGVARQAELATFLALTGIAGFGETDWCAMTGSVIPPATGVEPLAAAPG